MTVRHSIQSQRQATIAFEFDELRTILAAVKSFRRKRQRQIEKGIFTPKPGGMDVNRLHVQQATEVVAKVEAAFRSGGHPITDLGSRWPAHAIEPEAAEYEDSNWGDN